MNNWTDYEFECHSNGGKKATVKARERNPIKQWKDFYEEDLSFGISDLLNWD